MSKFNFKHELVIGAGGEFNGTLFGHHHQQQEVYGRVVKT